MALVEVLPFPAGAIKELFATGMRRAVGVVLSSLLPPDLEQAVMERQSRSEAMATRFLMPAISQLSIRNCSSP